MVGEGVTGWHKITPHYGLFEGAPGYDPLDSEDYKTGWTVPPYQMLVDFQQEDWRGGHVDIAQFVSPAPDIALHFYDEPTDRGEPNSRHALADMLMMIKLSVAFTRHGAPHEYPRSGLYFDLPDPERRCTYVLPDGELLIGYPEIYAPPASQPKQLWRRTDEHSAEVHRVVAGMDELGVVLGRCAVALGMQHMGRQRFVDLTFTHFRAAQTGRRLQQIGELFIAPEDI